MAAIAGMIGMPRLAGASATGAKILIYVALAVLLIWLVVGIFAVA